MNAEARRTLRQQLKRQGFDQTKSFRSGVVRAKCSQCEVMVIQGIACHETGCPNKKNKRR